MTLYKVIFQWKMPSFVINVDGVRKLLQRVNPSKDIDPDMLPKRVLRVAAPVIAPFLSFVFQQSIYLGSVPSNWKHAANIIAIDKKAG